MIKFFSLRSYTGKFAYLIGILLSLIIPFLMFVISSTPPVFSIYSSKREIWWFHSLSMLANEGKIPWGVLSVLNLCGLVILFLPVLRRRDWFFRIGCLVGNIIIIFFILTIIAPVIIPMLSSSIFYLEIVENIQDWKETGHNYHVVLFTDTYHGSSIYQLFDCDSWEIRCERIMAYKSSTSYRSSIKEIPDFKSLVHALSVSRSTAPYADNPLSAVLEIQGHTQYSSLISYTFQDSSTLAMQSTTTPAIPINVVSPFVASFSPPRTAPLKLLSLDIDPVGWQDELFIKEFNYRWWALNPYLAWDYWSSFGLPPEAIQNVRLALPPGLYVIRAEYSWDDKPGRDVYGFLVDVK
jgi:hypothetical protein